MSGKSPFAHRLFASLLALPARIRSLLKTHGLQAGLLLFCAAVTLLGYNALKGTQQELLPTPSPQPSGARIVSVADGSLLVGEVVVQPAKAFCEGDDAEQLVFEGECRFEQRPSVSVTYISRLALQAGSSKRFSVEAVDLEKPTRAAGLVVEQDRYLSASRAGKFLVTIIGARGGVWQFTLLVPDVASP